MFKSYYISSPNIFQKSSVSESLRVLHSWQLSSYIAPKWRIENVNVGDIRLKIDMRESLGYLIII